MNALKVTLLKQLLREVGYARLEVFGSSMLPVIHPGDVIVVESTPVRAGDIVLFDRDGHLCAHRFFAGVDGQVIARGDANRDLDTPFPFEQILGRVSSVERNGTAVTDLAFRPLASMFIRNSSLVRRLILRTLDLHRKRIHRVKVNSAFAKSKA